MADKIMAYVPQNWLLKSLSEITTASETAKDLFNGQLAQTEVLDYLQTLKIPDKKMTEQEALEWSHKFVAQFTNIKILQVDTELKQHGKTQGIAPIVAAALGIIIAPLVMAALGPIMNAAVAKPVTYWSNKQFRPEILAVGDLTSGYLRGEITDADYNDQMASHGYDQRKIDIIKKLANYIPNPGEIIRLAVREAFEPRDKLKIFTPGYTPPADYIKYAKMVGLTQDWAEREWHAHWQLPSPQQVAEMYHRKVITHDQMLNYYKILDYYKEDADRLDAISYNMPTRIDLRRMYQAGNLTYDELVDYYQKLGYSPEDASKICTWIKGLKTSTEKELTKTEIAKAIAIGELTEAEAITMFKNMGYDEAESKILIATYTAAGSSAKREMTRSLIEQGYKVGLIDKTTALNYLIGQGWSADSASYIITLVDTKRLLDLKVLPFGYMRDLYKYGIITEADFSTYLQNEGYIPQHIAWVMQYESGKIKKAT